MINPNLQQNHTQQNYALFSYLLSKFENRFQTCQVICEQTCIWTPSIPYVPEKNYNRTFRINNFQSIE